ncbi:hypothetical protein U9M48_008882 [Paspalum notatum var. saurae]|uniref:Uncharacterized protein n=1 Tax=Paspalum notatum var. saurae TaxID=547442 RepID=A0AAQ3WE50_PASNO
MRPDERHGDTASFSTLASLALVPLSGAATGKACGWATPAAWATYGASEQRHLPLVRCSPSDVQSSAARKRSSLWSPVHDVVIVQGLPKLLSASYTALDPDHVLTDSSQIKEFQFQMQVCTMSQITAYQEYSDIADEGFPPSSFIKRKRDSERIMMLQALAPASNKDSIPNTVYPAKTFPKKE